MRRAFIISVLLAASFLPAGSVTGQEPEPVVHALLFYSPTCVHCHETITEVLIPLQELHGRRLVLLGLDTTQPYGVNLYREMIEQFAVPQAEWVVPILVVGDEILIGGGPIAGRFAGIIEDGLEGNGIDLPDIPGVTAFLRQQDLLDTRFPDRRIARQDPLPADETPADSMPQTDTVPPARGQVASPDPSAAPADSVAPPQAPPVGAQASVDTVEVVRAPVGEPLVEDTVKVAEPAADPIVPEEEAGPVQPENPAEAEAQPNAPAPEIAQPREQDPTPPPAGAPLGLVEAAREIESMTMWDRFNLDPAGNSLSVVVLLIMLVSLVLKGYPPRAKGGEWAPGLIPALVVVGFGVAVYLSYIELTQVEAVCGPFGDCNTVNQSKYATLFGVLPVGVLGLMGYVVILGFWGMANFGPANFRARAVLGAWAAVLFGVLFSVYLTFLEPFVIGATCIWCLTSAMVMTLLLWTTTPMARDAWPDGGAGEG